jgi:hypothetical protein
LKNFEKNLNQKIQDLENTEGIGYEIIEKPQILKKTKIEKISF